MKTSTAPEAEIPNAFVGQKNPLIAALLGNPNVGKTSVFNQLTGLNQKVGNFSGVTVEKKTGRCRLPDGRTAEIIDLPGTYSLYPKSGDERLTAEILLDKNNPSHPDVVIAVIDAAQAERGLLNFTQARDAGLPVLAVFNMSDAAENAGIFYDKNKMEQLLGVPTVFTDARSGKGFDQLLQQLSEGSNPADFPAFFRPSGEDAKIAEKAGEILGENNIYYAQVVYNQYSTLEFLSKEQKISLSEIPVEAGRQAVVRRSEEIISRLNKIREICRECRTEHKTKVIPKFDRISDQILSHPLWGYTLFIAVLLLMFQAVFSWSAGPMDLIDAGTAALADAVKKALPGSLFAGLLADGIIAGIGGVIIFVPQIAVLFAFIAVLEESGYMARIMFMTDRIMQKFGLNGKSIVPLISGAACAIPAIMSARNIDNPKERLITIFVTPFISCSARLPVYTVIIGLVIPNREVFGFLNMQGLTLAGMYFLGFAAALISALLMHKLSRTESNSYFVTELPPYRLPKLKNVLLTIINKVKSFVLEAGKIILAVSVVLWLLASYGPGDAMEKAESAGRANTEITEEEIEAAVASARLEASYAGHLGKFIEPAIRPMGYDWKIGIALITSFAAREVFVGTMSTIYSLGEGSNDEITLRERLKKEKNPLTGEPMFSPALGFSLLIFYAFAMQCMSTLAVVYRETGHIKWPVLQFIYMSGLAYLCAFLAYSFFA